MKKALILFLPSSESMRIGFRETTRNRLIIPFLREKKILDSSQLVNLITTDIFNKLRKTCDYNSRLQCKHNPLSMFMDFNEAPPWQRNEYGILQANPGAIISDNALSSKFMAACVPEIESQLNLIQIETSVAYLLHPDLHFDDIHYIPLSQHYSYKMDYEHHKLIRESSLKQFKMFMQEDLKDAASTNKPIRQFLHTFTSNEAPENTQSAYKEILDFIKRTEELTQLDTEYYVDASRANGYIQQAVFAILQQAIIRGKQICMPNRKNIPWHSLLDGKFVLSHEYFRPQISYEDPADIWKLIQTTRPPTSDIDIIRGGINTKNDAYRKLTEEITKIAQEDQCGAFLFLGETGVGKTEIVKHIMAIRKKKNMQRSKCVSENCATLETLTESTLFGSVKGGFTDAVDHPGRLKEADGGVLFLDEIGELTLPVQAKLLKAIEEKKFYRVGSNKEETSDFQLICGTNHDLEDDVKKGKFRSDLLYRINIWTFTLPPLRERIKDDIEDLIEEWLNNPKRCTVQPHPYFDTQGKELFIRFATSPNTRWNGNFREFNTMLHKMSVRAKGSCINYEVVEKSIKESAYSDFLKPSTDSNHEQIADSKAPAGGIIHEASNQESTTQPELETTWNSFNSCKSIDKAIIELIGMSRFENLNGKDRSILRGIVEVCSTSYSCKEAESKFYDNTSGALSRLLERFGLHFNAKSASFHHLERIAPLCE